MDNPFWSGFAKRAGERAHERNLLDIQDKIEKHKNFSAEMQRISEDPSYTPEAQRAAKEKWLEAQQLGPMKFKNYDISGILTISRERAAAGTPRATTPSKTAPGAVVSAPYPSGPDEGLDPFFPSPTMDMSKFQAPQSALPSFTAQTTPSGNVETPQGTGWEAPPQAMETYQRSGKLAPEEIGEQQALAYQRKMEEYYALQERLALLRGKGGANPLDLKDTYTGAQIKQLIASGQNVELPQGMPLEDFGIYRGGKRRLDGVWEFSPQIAERFTQGYIGASGTPVAFNQYHGYQNALIAPGTDKPPIPNTRPVYYFHGPNKQWYTNNLTSTGDFAFPKWVKSGTAPQGYTPSATTSLGRTDLGNSFLFLPETSTRMPLPTGTFPGGVLPADALEDADIMPTTPPVTPSSQTTAQTGSFTTPQRPTSVRNHYEQSGIAPKTEPDKEPDVPEGASVSLELRKKQVAQNKAFSKPLNPLDTSEKGWKAVQESPIFKEDYEPPAGAPVPSADGTSIDLVALSPGVIPKGAYKAYVTERTGVRINPMSGGAFQVAKNQRFFTPQQVNTAVERSRVFNTTLELMRELCTKENLKLLNNMFTAGELDILTREGTGYGFISAALGKFEQMIIDPNDPEAQKRWHLKNNMIAVYKNLKEHVQVMRTPLGAAGFRSLEAFFSLQAQKGNLLNRPEVTRIVLQNSMKTLLAIKASYDSIPATQAELQLLNQPMVADEFVIPQFLTAYNWNKEAAKAAAKRFGYVTPQP